LQEFSCNSAVPGTTIQTGYNCPKGCLNGACVGACVPLTCGIKNCGTWVNGTCSGTLNCGTCPGGQTCNTNGQCVVNNQTVSCTDSDGPNNFNVSGYVIKGETYYYDYCVDKKAFDYACSGNTVIISNYTCPDDCNAGACIKSITGQDYSIALISATDTSATIKVTKPGDISEVKELAEGSSKVINGLSTYLLEADANEISGYELAKTRYTLVLGHGGTNPDIITLKLSNGLPSQHRFELVSATDTSAIIKVTDMNTGLYGIKEVVEGGSYLINGVTLTLNNADETPSSILADFNVEPFTFTIKNAQPFCTDSDGGLNYYTLGKVSTQSGNYTDYCNTTGTTWLNEYYCSGNYFAVSNYKCPYGCKAGACIREPVIEKRKATCKGLQCVSNFFSNLFK
jgi:hypothetical protein